MKWREGRSNKKWRERVVIIVNKFQGEFSTFYHFSNRGDKVFWYVARRTDGEKGGAERPSYPPGGGSLLIIDPIIRSISVHEKTNIRPGMKSIINNSLHDNFILQKRIDDAKIKIKA